MKRLLAPAALLGALATSGHALTITLDAESLKDALGAPMQVSGLVVLTAGTSGSFFGPSPTSLVGGDEIIVQKWDLSAFATPGVLSDLTTDLPLTGAWTQGDPLRLYWYPTLDLADTAPGIGTAYGTYRDASVLGLDGSAPWLTPAASDTISLKFATSDAAFLFLGGSNAPSAGIASLTVVPEPGTAAFGALLCAATGLVRRRTSVARRPASPR